MRLGDLVKLYKGRKPLEIVNEPIEGYRRSLQISDLRPGAKPRYCPADRKELLAVPSDVIIAWDGANAGTTSHGLKGSVGSTLTVLRIQQKELIDTAYLGHFIASKQSYLRTKAKGATIPHLDRVILESLDIPLPPLEEQKRIVSILDKAKSIQEARERQLAALDELASSLFVKYFGHPSLSPKYKTVSIGDICKVATGNSPSKKDINNYGNVIEWVKSDNLGGLHPSKAKEYLSEQGKDKGRVAPPGSILVTCIAGSRNSIGKCSLVDREITFNQQINAIYPSNNILSDFLYYQIKIFPYLVQEKISGGMKGIVNKSKFESIKIILPPKEIQEEFSKITQRIRIQKECIQKSSDLSKNLFSSLELNLFYH